MRFLLSLLLLSAQSTPQGTAIKGKIVEVSGYAVKIELEAGAVAQSGDSVAIGFDAPRVGMVPIEGAWRVSRVDGRVLSAEPVGSTAQPRVGQVASITPGRAGAAGVGPGGRKFGNRDVLDFHKAGLGSEILVEKIRTSVCEFDTSAEAMIQLKSAGVPEAVLLAMVRVPSPKPAEAAPAPAPAVGPEARGSAVVPVEAGPPAAAFPAAAPAAVPAVQTGMMIRYVKSDRKWRLGLRSEPYNKISEYFDKQLTKELGSKGFQKVPAVVDHGCCVITIELLQVTSRPAMVKKPGVDISANLTLTDGAGRTVYSKGFRGESKTVLNTWGNLIEHAAENMAKNVAADEMFVRVLATGAMQ